VWNRVERVRRVRNGTETGYGAQLSGPSAPCTGRHQAILRSIHKDLAYVVKQWGCTPYFVWFRHMNLAQPAWVCESERGRRVMRWKHTFALGALVEEARFIVEPLVDLEHLSR